MSQTAFFLIQLVMPVVISLGVATYLNEVTQPLLYDLCGTEDRARFWSRCFNVAMLSVPFTLVLVAVPEHADGMQSLRQTLAWTAGGILAVIGGTALIIGQSLPARNRGRD